MESIVDLTTEEQLVKFSHAVFAQLSTNRVFWDKQSIENHRFASGDHYNFKTYTGGGMSIPTKMGRKVMLSTCLLESKRNMILQSDPKPIVSQKVNPKDLQQAKLIATATENALNDVLDYEDFEYKMSEVVMNAMIDNVAYFELYNDPSGIHIGTQEFRDVYIPVGLRSLASSPIVGKKFKGIIGDYRNNPDYITKNVEKLKNDQGKVVTMATYRTQDDYRDYDYTLKDLNHFEAMEWQVLFSLSERTIKKLKNKYKWVQDKEPGDKIMRLFSVSGDTLIRDTYCDVDRYYMYEYNALGGILYQPSLFRRLISLNQAYNNVWSLIEEYLAYAVRYRLLMPRGDAISQVTNKNGTKIFYENEAPTPLKQSPIDPAVFNILNKYEETMQTIMNISDSSMGEMASGSKKFKAMETQKQQDMFNTRTIINNLRISLKHMTKGMLDLIDESYKIKDLVYENGGNINTIKIAGAKYADYNPMAVNKYSPEELVIIKKDYPVDIKIASGLDYAENSVREQLFQLATTEAPQNPIIPVKAYLDSVDDEVGAYVERAQREQEEAAQTPAMENPNAQQELQQPSLPGMNPQMGVQTGTIQIPQETPTNLATQPNQQLPINIPQNLPQKIATPHPLHVLRNVHDIAFNHLPATEEVKPTKSTKIPLKKSTSKAKKTSTKTKKK